MRSFPQDDYIDHIRQAPRTKGSTVRPRQAYHVWEETVGGGRVSEFRVLSQSVISLMPTQPAAKNATATAALDFNEDTVEIVATGLPNPSVFGTDPSTGRPFNVYEAWLLDTTQNLFASIGIMTLQQGAYRIKATAPISLREFNAVAITVEDKTGPQTANGPFVMMGTFREVIRKPTPRKPLG